MAIVLDGSNGITTNSGTVISASTIGVGGATPSTSGAGITFPATQSASTDANTLDDYEEGSFTPTVSAGITSPTYARQSGIYTKIGNLVQIQISIETSGGTRNANLVNIGNLPFTQANFNGGPGFTIAYVSAVVNSTTTNLPTVYGDSNTTTLTFYKTDSSGFTGNDLQSASFRVDITGTYRAA